MTILEGLEPEFTYTRRGGMKAVTHYVYVAWGSLARRDAVYVGQTMSPTHAMSGHRKSSKWWESMRCIDFYRCKDLREALALETSLIHELRPTYNVAHGSYPVAGS
jgi:hypothetical protein